MKTLHFTSINGLRIGIVLTGAFFIMLAIIGNSFNAYAACATLPNGLKTCEMGLPPPPPTHIFTNGSINNNALISPALHMPPPPDVLQTLPPLMQLNYGVLAKDVKCKQDLQLVIKTEDGSPACVKHGTAQILIERGWAESIISGISQTNPLPKGAQVDLTNVSVWTCGAGTKIATFVDTSGFVNITKANEPNKGLPSDWNDFFDFVLKPNSTGYIDMSFEFFGESYGVDNKQYNGSIQSSIGLLSQYGTISNAFNKTAIYTLDNPNVSHTSNLNGIHIFTINTENVTNHTLKITYVIKVDSSAKEGTYGIGIPYTCPLELLTIGDHSYTGSMPWHRGIY